MLTSFFSKSNPVNYVVVGLMLLFWSFVFAFFIDKEGFTMLYAINKISGALLLIFLFLLLDFILRKNKMHKANTLGIYVFVCLLASTPSILLSNKIIAMSIFLLLGIRKIFSLKTKKNSTLKILDATVWITVASLINGYSLLFIIALYVALFKRNTTKIKEYFIPFFGIAAIGTIYYAAFIIMGKDVLQETNALFQYTISIEPYLVFVSQFQAIKVVVLFLISVILIIVLLSRQNTSKVFLNSILVALLILAGIFSVVQPIKNGSEFVYLYVVFAMLIPLLLQKIPKKAITELFLWILLLLPALPLYELVSNS